jgi:hypothetical protein
VTRGLEQLDQLLGEWVTESKKYSEGRGQTTVAPTEGGNTIARAEEFFEDGTNWEVDFDLTYTKVRS